MPAVLALIIILVSLSGCDHLQINPGTSLASLDPAPASPATTPVDLAVVPAAQPEDLPVQPGATSAPSLIEDPVAPMAPAELWQRVRNGFALDHEVDRRRVQLELKWYRDNPDYVRRVAKRAEPHLHYIVGELEKRGMPLEFALLPIVESAYDPFAYSHGRAAGLWQFIPATARVYGLKINWWYDGRRDVRESTRAALDYLQHLHRFFEGNWLLAIAAYNAGEGNVLSSIRASGQSRQQADFWSLKVFRETYTYVPRLLAISEVIMNPARYEITLPVLEDKAQWVAVSTGSQLDLHKAAELADMDPETLYRLNAGYNQWATHPDGPHELLLPSDRVEPFTTALANLAPEDRLAWQRHRIRSGETLGGIARKYRTTITAIRQANNIRGNLIQAGDSLMIPSASSDVEYNMSTSGRLASKQAGLAKKYGGDPIIYEVRPGDSFWGISRQYGVSMRELARWNGLGTTSTLYPGMKLKVFKQVTASLQETRPTRSQQIRKLNYRVREGESLSLIASKFNVTVQNIRSWNQAARLKKYIHPGDYLTLYVDVTALVN